MIFTRMLTITPSGPPIKSYTSLFDIVNDGHETGGPFAG
jgi:hypothetical protein